MKFSTLFLSICFFTSCYHVERNCQDYKTGDFYSEVVVDGKVYKSSFKRTAQIQVEVYNSKTDSSQLRWINDCEVIFKTIHPKNMVEKKDIHLKILTTTDSSYTYEYAYVGETNKQTGIAYRIN